MRRRRHNYRRAGLVVLGAFVAVFLFVFLNHAGVQEETAEAASLSAFDPGYIISDYQMGNYTAMSEAEIQSFLTSKNACGNTDHSYYLRLSANGNYKWHFENGHFVCLSEERFGDGEVIGEGETAAHIIWQAAQDYQINPQVLIVLLQKETGLITDPIPNDKDYRKAAGYGCPDTAACAEKYYGFKNQVRSAAALFRTVLNGGWTNYPLGENYVQYNPSAGCGGAVVNIRSLATSALYRYTPYQPNAASLAAGYGYGDACSAYGNRNFYLYFEDWFGGVTSERAVIPESSDVASGEYMIKSMLGNNLVIDVAAGVLRSGANIQVYTSNGSDAQRWTLQRDDDGSYAIINSASGKAIDILEASTKSGANVQLYSWNGSCAQKWKIVENEDKTYTIYSTCSGNVLDVAGAVGVLGANVQSYKASGSRGQKWELVPLRDVDDGEYNIVSSLSNGLLLDSGSGTDGANVSIASKSNATGQVWKITYGEDGYYTIEDAEMGTVLMADSEKIHNGTNARIGSAADNCTQKWRIVKSGNKYVIYSACAEMALDVLGGAGRSGVNVQMYQANDSEAQKWSFVVAQKGSTRTKETAKTETPKTEDKPAVEPAPAQAYDKYRIVSALAGNLSLGSVGGENWANVQLALNGAQAWGLARDNNTGHYTIINVASGRVLDVLGGSVSNGANVQIYDANGSCAQQWSLEYNSDGTASFYSVCSGLALDVWAGAGKDGTNIHIYSRNGSIAQKWRIMSAN